LIPPGCLPMLTFHHILHPDNEGRAAIFDLYSRLGLWKRLSLYPTRIHGHTPLYRNWDVG
jgi:hypothetical protein